MKVSTKRRAPAASDPIFAVIRSYSRFERAAIRASDAYDERAERRAAARVTAALEAIATTPATTLDGAIAKLKWIGKGIRVGHLKIDAAVLAGAIADIQRLAACSA